MQISEAFKGISLSINVFNKLCNVGFFDTTFARLPYFAALAHRSLYNKVITGFSLRGIHDKVKQARYYIVS